MKEWTGEDSLAERWECLLEMIARVLNMPIGLKGNNYYSKVFKRVNYKL